MMKKIISLLLVFVFFFRCDLVLAENLYYVPNKGDSYFRSQHLFSFYDNNGRKNNNTSPIIHTVIRNGVDTSELNSAGDFSKLFNVPWTPDEKDYYLVFCIDGPTPVAELSEYRMVPIEDSTYISESAKSHLIGIVRKVWPYIDFDEAINNMVKDGALVAKVVDGETYYTSPLNTKVTKSVTKHELTLATQMAIYLYSNPGSVKDIYQYTTTIDYRTVLFPFEPFDSPWEEGIHQEVNNNVMSIYNYLIKQTGSNIKFKIESASVSGQNVTIKTNREITSKDDITLKIKQNDVDLGSYKLSSFKKGKNNTYTLAVKNVKDGDVQVTYSGDEYSNLRAYVLEAVDGKEAAQTFITLGSEYLPVSGAVGASNVANPNTLDNVDKDFYNVFIFVTVISVVGASIYVTKKHQKRS